MSKLIIAGGSGFVGRHITNQATKLGHEVVVLSRSGKAPAGARGVKWDAESLAEWTAELEDSIGIINLTGESVAIPWTKENRHSILHSRVRSTQIIGEAIQKCKIPPKAWVNGCAVGFYGDRGSEELTEESGVGKRGDFLVDVCFAWEQMVRDAHTPDTRKSLIRTGFVLGKDGGPLAQLTKLANLFLGGHHGSGAQTISWIHIDDLTRLFLLCVDKEMPLIVNGTAPVPCSNRFFMASLRGILGRPWSPSVPKFVLKIAQMFGAPDSSLVLNGQRALPRAALDAGFNFHFEELRNALIDLNK